MISPRPSSLIRFRNPRRFWRAATSASGCEVMIMVRKNSCAFTVETFYVDNVNVSYQSNITQAVLVKAGYRYGFNGQEKDNEVLGEGNSYTAEFWNYDARLGRRCNVDPVEKTWESSFACFSNNPLTFTDPSGADVEYGDQKDKEFVETFTQEYIPRRKWNGDVRQNSDGTIKMKRNKNYVASFAEHIKNLDSKEETYIISFDPSLSGGTSGKFDYLGNNKFLISYSTPSRNHGGYKAGVLFEEVFHAVQFTDSKFNFKNENGRWVPEGLDIYDELEAKRYASISLANTRDYKPSFNFYVGGGIDVPTQMTMVLKVDDVAIRYLTEKTVLSGIKQDRVGDKTTYTRVEHDHTPAYSSDDILMKRTPASTKRRTFNSNVVGY